MKIKMILCEKKATFGINEGLSERYMWAEKDPARTAAVRSAWYIPTEFK